MSTRWPTHCLCALICGIFACSVQAKPPDLPVQATVECKEHDPRAPQYGVSAVPQGAIQLDDEDATPCVEEAEAPIDTFCPFLAGILRGCQERFDNCLHPRWEAPSAQPSAKWTFTVEVVSAAKCREQCGCPFMQACGRCCACLADAAQICWDDLKDCVHKTVSGSEEAETPDTHPEASQTRPGAWMPVDRSNSDTTCPYLREKQSQSPAPSASMPMMTPLDNLKKLQQAEKMLRAAERFEQIGENDKALKLYQRIQYLCPGSRFAIIAAKRVAELSAANNSQDESDTKRVEERVAELLEASQRALAEGRYEEATRCAKQAQKLDPTCVAANTLVYKMHLLLQIQEKARKAERAERKRKLADAKRRMHELLETSEDLKQLEAEWEQWYGDAPVQLQPHMPPVDDNIVADFEQVLTDNDAVVVARRCQEEMVGWLMAQYATLYKAGQYREAEAVAREAHEVDPHNTAVSAATLTAHLRALEAARQHQGSEEAEPVDGSKEEDNDSQASAGAIDQVLDFLHNQTGVEIAVMAANGARFRYERAGVSCCVVTAAEGFQYCVQLLPAALGAKQDTQPSED